VQPPPEPAIPRTIGEAAELARRLREASAWSRAAWAARAAQTRQRVTVARALAGSGRPLPTHVRGGRRAAPVAPTRS
jgi:hypothetical protein